MRGFAPGLLQLVALSAVFCAVLLQQPTSAVADHAEGHPADNADASAEPGHATGEPEPEAASSETEPGHGDHGSGEHEAEAEPEPEPEGGSSKAESQEDTENGGSHVGALAPAVISLALLASFYAY